MRAGHLRRIGALVACAAVLLALLGAGASGGSRQLRVAFVSDIISTSRHDLRGVAYVGFLRAVKAFGVQGRAVQRNPKTGLGPTLTELARQRYDLIYTGILNSDEDLRAIVAVAASFP